MGAIDWVGGENSTNASTTQHLAWALFIPYYHTQSASKRQTVLQRPSPPIAKKCTDKMKRKQHFSSGEHIPRNGRVLIPARESGIRACTAALAAPINRPYDTPHTPLESKRKGRGPGRPDRHIGPEWRSTRSIIALFRMGDGIVGVSE